MSRVGAVVVRSLVPLVVLAVAALTGCGSDLTGPADPTPDAVSTEATSAEDAPDAEPAEPGESVPGIGPAEVVNLPEDFPESVPVYPGPLTQANSITTGEDTGYWNLHVRVSDAVAAMTGVRTELTDAGFEERAWTEMDRLVSGTFSSADLRVSVQSSKDINGEMLLYTVIEI